MPSSLKALLDKQEGSAGRRSGGDVGGGTYGRNNWPKSNDNSWDRSKHSQRCSGGSSRFDALNSDIANNNNRTHDGSYSASTNTRWRGHNISDHSSSRSSRPAHHEPSYEERMAAIEKDAKTASRKGKNIDNKCNYDDEQDVNSISSWVGPLIDGKCTFYQDRDKRYPFTTGERGYALLQQLLEKNKDLLRLNWEQIEEEAASNGTSADVVIRMGHGLYADKPTLRTKGVTWSTEEYSHPGLQRMYLRMKSIQRFTEVWAMLERSADIGVFDQVFGQGTGTVRIAAVGGGPGYELLAARLFFLERDPEITLELICMDVCPAWKPYAELLGFRFVYYDINDVGTNPLQLAGLQPGELHFCIVSCVMVYVTNDQTLDMFHRLIHEGGVNAILQSERGEKTRSCLMMEDRGGVVTRLIDQSFGVDERQVVMSSREFDDSNLHKPKHNNSVEPTFPNVPFCEHKEQRRHPGRRR